MAIVEQTNEGVKLFIKVVPNTSANEFAGKIGNRVKIRVKSPPESGKANKAVIVMISDLLGLKKNAVSILFGNKNPKKTVGIFGVSVDIVRSKLGLD